MEEKRELTLEELEAKCAELADAYESMCKRVDELKAKQEKEKREKLKSEETERRKEIDDLYAILAKLMHDFYVDYGYYPVPKSNSFVPINKIFDFFVF